MADDVERELRLGVEGPVATIWIDRPAKRNALALRHWDRLADLVTQLDGWPAVRALVVRSTDPEIFCSGADIDEFGAARSDSASAAEYTAAFDVGVAALASVGVPTVAVVRGLCFGGGLEIVQACDIAVADLTARFGLSPASLGIVYPYQATRRLVAAWGVRQARLMLSTGGTADARRAYELGVVAELVENDEIDVKVAALTARIAALSPVALAAMKTIVSGIAAGHPEVAGRAERVIAAAIDSPDYAEGLAAFAEKRRPSFGTAVQEVVDDE